MLRKAIVTVNEFLQCMLNKLDTLIRSFEQPDEGVGLSYT